MGEPNSISLVGAFDESSGPYAQVTLQCAGSGGPLGTVFNFNNRAKDVVLVGGDGTTSVDISKFDVNDRGGSFVMGALSASQISLVDCNIGPTLLTVGTVARISMSSTVGASSGVTTLAIVGDAPSLDLVGCGVQNFDPTLSTSAAIGNEWNLSGNDLTSIAVADILSFWANQLAAPVTLDISGGTNAAPDLEIAGSVAIYRFQATGSFDTPSESEAAGHYFEININEQQWRFWFNVDASNTDPWDGDDTYPKYEVATQSGNLVVDIASALNDIASALNDVISGIPEISPGLSLDGDSLMISRQQEGFAPDPSYVGNISVTVDTQGSGATNSSIEAIIGYGGSVVYNEPEE